MTAFLQYIEQLSSGQKLLWVGLCLSFAWLLEAGLPLFQFQYKKWKHAAINIFFLGCSVLINFFVGLIAVSVFVWIGKHQIGLLYVLPFPVWAELLLTVMLLDFVGQYVIHYFLHKVKWMWKFHMIHHSDSTVDATSGTRHHPGDYFIRELVVLGAVVLIGCPLSFYLIYRLLTVFFTYFTHANIALPSALDRALSWVFITPNVHKFHHHFERPWTDSNYGNIFSLWDRIFGTFVYEDPKQIQYGLDVLDNQTDQDILFQLKMPFDKNIQTDT